MKIRKYILGTVFVAITLVSNAWANLAIFACEPEWGALAQELGGDQVEIYTATTALQDPHQIQARPSLIAHARKADLMICSGAELETGWLPQVQRQSGNSKIQVNGAGYFEASSVVQRLEVPTVVDRSEGDVHPGGNPHIQTDPHNIAAVATALATKMATLDAPRADLYQQRYRDFAKRWATAIVHWEAAAAPLNGMTIVAHHKYWVYLLQWLKLQEIATLEPKPGVPANVTHLAEILTTLHQTPARCILRTPYDDPQPSQWLAERATIPAILLPGTVGGLPGTDTLFGVFDVTIAELLKAVR